MDENVTKIDRLLKLFPLYSEDLGMDLATPSGRFRWFVAAFLFGARIGEQIENQGLLFGRTYAMWTCGAF